MYRVSIVQCKDIKNYTNVLKNALKMDIINECEWEVLDFGGSQLICFEALYYWCLTFEEISSGMGHLSFKLNLN